MSRYVSPTPGPTPSIARDVWRPRLPRTSQTKKKTKKENNKKEIAINENKKKPNKTMEDMRRLRFRMKKKKRVDHQPVYPGVAFVRTGTGHTRVLGMYHVSTVCTFPESSMDPLSGIPPPRGTKGTQYMLGPSTNIETSTYELPCGDETCAPHPPAPDGTDPVSTTPDGSPEALLAAIVSLPDIRGYRFRHRTYTKDGRLHTSWVPFVPGIHRSNAERMYLERLLRWLVRVSDTVAKDPSVEGYDMLEGIYVRSGRFQALLTRHEHLLAVFTGRRSMDHQRFSVIRDTHHSRARPRRGIGIATTMRVESLMSRLRRLPCMGTGHRKRYLYVRGNRLALARLSVGIYERNGVRVYTFLSDLLREVIDTNHILLQMGTTLAWSVVSDILAHCTPLVSILSNYDILYATFHRHRHRVQETTGCAYTHPSTMA